MPLERLEQRLRDGFQRQGVAIDPRADAAFDGVVRRGSRPGGPPAPPPPRGAPGGGAGGGGLVAEQQQPPPPPPPPRRWPRWH